jgi:predicted HicB family RNase H-like nuclease
MPDQPDFKRLMVNVTPEQHEFLRKVAFRRRVSVALLVRELIEEAERRPELLRDPASGR